MTVSCSPHSYRDYFPEGLVDWPQIAVKLSSVPLDDDFQDTAQSMCCELNLLNGTRLATWPVKATHEPRRICQAQFFLLDDAAPFFQLDRVDPQSMRALMDRQDPDGDSSILTWHPELLTEPPRPKRATLQALAPGLGAALLHQLLNQANPPQATWPLLATWALAVDPRRLAEHGPIFSAGFYGESDQIFDELIQEINQDVMDAAERQTIPAIWHNALMLPAWKETLLAATHAFLMEQRMQQSFPTSEANPRARRARI